MCSHDYFQVAETAPCTPGMCVYFVPAFSGLQAPYNDDMAAVSFIGACRVLMFLYWTGITEHTQRAHLVRAVLVSLVFRVYDIFSIMLRETRNRPTVLRCVCAHLYLISNVCIAQSVRWRVAQRLHLSTIGHTVRRVRASRRRSAIGRRTRCRTDGHARRTA